MRRIRGGRGIRAVGRSAVAGGRRRAVVFSYHLVVSSYLLSLFFFSFLLKNCLVSQNSDIWFSKFKLLIKMLR